MTNNFNKNNVVQLEVPIDILENMQTYMNSLLISDEDKIEEDIDEEQCEVICVKNHRLVDNNWQFEIMWKNGQSEWVDDNKCSCEILINKYLQNIEQKFKTAYIFCRVSTPEQATDDNLSLHAQEDELRDAVDKLGCYDRVRVYSISQSAYKNIPKTLIRIGESVIPGDGIFVWRADRLGRNIVSYLDFIEDLNKREIFIYSHQESMNYKDNKLEFIQAILNGQKESKIIGERVKLAFRRKIARGDERIGRLPFGKKYKRVLVKDSTNNTTKMIVVDNIQEQYVILRICKNKGKKMPKAIADELNAEGIKKKGRKWTKIMVSHIMRNH
jgi:DNA invertase Pin-like site-specific DNA recombinase